MKKLAVFLAAVLGSLLLIEGVLSLAFGTSVRALLGARARVVEPEPFLATDRDRAIADQPDLTQRRPAQRSGRGTSRERDQLLAMHEQAVDFHEAKPSTRGR